MRSTRLAALALCGCFTRPGLPQGNGDGGPPDASADSAVCAAFGPWGPVVELTALNFQGQDDFQPALSGDNTRLIFYSDRDADQDRKLWEATWNPSTERYENPVMIQAGLSSFAQAGRLSPDGLTLWYSQDDGDKDIARVTRASVTSPFLDANAMLVAPFAEADFDEVGIGFTLDELVAVVTQNPSADQYDDIWVAERDSTGVPYTKPTKVVDDDGYACCGAISPDGLMLLWEGSPGLGSYGVYQVTRTTRTASWGIPAPFPPLTSPGARQDGDPFISYDGTILVFASWDPALAPSQDFDLYMMRRECIP